MPHSRDHLFVNRRLDRVAEWFFTVGMGVLFAFFAYRFGRDAWATHRLSSVLAVALSSLRAILYLTRRRPQQVSVDPYAWGVGVCGTWAPLLFLVVPGEERQLGQVLQVVGFAIQVVAVTSLNRSIGIVAANRGIRTGGLYRFVRHPLYGSYFISNAGLLINHYSVHNALVAAFWAFFQLMRIRYEEELLSLDLEYQEYRRRTRWRLIPFVF